MGNPRGIKRDFKALERRRFEALKLLKKGYNQSEVGRRTKVCSQTVSRWARMVAEAGDRALEAVGRPSPRGRSKSGRQLKKAQKEGRTIVFIDESGLSQRLHLGPPRTDSGAAVSLQLEDHFRGRGHDAV